MPKHISRGGHAHKKLSKIMTGNAQDSIIPIEMYLCTQCGKALQELLPLELRDKPSSIVE